MRRFGLEESYIEKLFCTYWENSDSSIKTIDGLIPLVAELGVSQSEFTAMINSEEIRQEFIDLTQLSLSKEIFGAPIMVVEEEIYWGKDRFDFIRDHLVRLTS